FVDAALPTQIYTLSLHDALPILKRMQISIGRAWLMRRLPISRMITISYHGKSFFRSNKTLSMMALLICSICRPQMIYIRLFVVRSEEHTSELQSRENLVCRLLLE